MNCGSEEESELVANVLSLLDSIPGVKKDLIPVVKELTLSPFVSTRVAAVRIRIHQLHDSDPSQLLKEWPIYLDDREEQVRNSAISSFSRAYNLEPDDRPVKIPQSTSWQIQDRAAFGEILLSRVVNPESYSYELGHCLLEFPCQLPTHNVGSIQRAFECKTFTETTFADLLQKVRPDWTDSAYVSAVCALLACDKFRPAFLGAKREKGCPWETSLNLLEEADINVVVETMQRPEFSNKSQMFFERLSLVACDTDFHPFRSHDRNGPSGWAEPSAFASRALDILARLASTNWGESEIWKLLDDSKDNGLRNVLLKVLSLPQNCKLTSFTRAQRLLTPATQKGDCPESRYLIQIASNLAKKDPPEGLSKLLKELYLELKHKKASELAAAVINLLISIDPIAARAVVEESQGTSAESNAK